MYRQQKLKVSYREHWTVEQDSLRGTHQSLIHAPEVTCGQKQLCVMVDLISNRNKTTDASSKPALYSHLYHAGTEWFGTAEINHLNLRN